MSARRHTPGPWNRGFGQNVYQGERADPTGRQRLIATCEPTTRTGADWEETWSNATLIAAAPEMLAALEMVAEYLNHVGGARHGLLIESYEAVRAAIIKAKGVAA